MGSILFYVDKFKNKKYERDFPANTDEQRQKVMELNTDLLHSRSQLQRRITASFRAAHGLIKANVTKSFDGGVVFKQTFLDTANFKEQPKLMAAIKSNGGARCWIV